jgi:membrane associated rhomboid family serine protease
LLEQNGLVLTGRIYYQYLQSLNPTALNEKPKWALAARQDNYDHLGLLGVYALRDNRFFEEVDDLNIKGDQVQIAAWRSQFKEFKESYIDQVLFRFGLSGSETHSLSWITYQFAHSSWIHLLSNLLFLITIGASVERLVGGFGLLFIYLMGGFAGGLGFLLTQAHGAIPVVGASASISALMAFIVLAEERPRIRYFYFISPVEGLYGYIYLPTFLIVPLFLVVDVASLMATPEGLGSGVAYSAHIGGAILGFALGALVRHSSFMKTSYEIP